MNLKKIRTQIIDGNTWYLGCDVSDFIGYGNYVGCIVDDNKIQIKTTIEGELIYAGFVNKEGFNYAVNKSLDHCNEEIKRLNKIAKRLEGYKKANHE